MIPLLLQKAVVQSLSGVWLFVTPWTAAHQSPLSSTISQSLFKFMSIELVMLSNHLTLCHSFSFCLQSFPASESFPISWLCIRWPKYWSFSFSISPANEFCCSVPQSCLAVCDPMDCSTPGCPSPSSAACSNSCPLSWWCHPTIIHSFQWIFRVDIL